MFGGRVRRAYVDACDSASKSMKAKHVGTYEYNYHAKKKFEVDAESRRLDESTENGPSHPLI